MYSITTVAIETFCAAWVFMTGASIGSFLNVVAYRVPRGKTFTGHSYCPHCRQPILFRDNIPVFGWIFLRGRCRTCRLPISPRYPIVELLVGLMYLVIGFPILGLGGTNFPGIGAPFYWGFAWNFLDMKPNILALFLSRTFLATALVACALIEWDRFRVPRSVIVVLLVAAVIITRTDPALIDGSMYRIPAFGSGWCWATLQGRLSGALIMGLMGCSFGLEDGRNDPASSSLAATVWISGLVGWWIGGYAAMSMLVLMAAVRLWQRFSSRFGGHNVARFLSRPSGWLLASWLLQWTLWSLLAKLPRWPIGSDSYPYAFAWVAPAVLLLLVVHVAAVPSDPPAARDDRKDHEDERESDETEIADRPDTASS